MIETATVRIGWKLQGTTYPQHTIFQAAYFDRDDVALQGFAKRFRENSDEEREHAQKLIKYQ